LKGGKVQFHVEASWIQAIAASAAAIAAVCSAFVAYSQHQLNQKSLLVPLAQRMFELERIDPTNPNEGQIRMTLNQFELIGYLCEAGALDEKLVERTWGNVIISICDQVSALPKVGNESGKELLQRMSATSRLYDRVDKERKKRLSYKQQ
jgi:hypothetical protein